MAEINPADVPAELVERFATAIEQHVAMVGPRVIPYREIAPIVLAAVLPLIQQQTRAAVAAELEAHAESIGWYEGGGVWAEALDVVQRGGGS